MMPVIVSGKRTLWKLICQQWREMWISHSTKKQSAGQPPWLIWWKCAGMFCWIAKGRLRIFNCTKDKICSLHVLGWPRRNVAFCDSSQMCWRLTWWSTNQEDRPLLTASVCTSQGKHIVVCQMLLYHECKISFWWFSSCIANFGRTGESFMSESYHDRWRFQQDRGSQLCNWSLHATMSQGIKLQMIGCSKRTCHSNRQIEICLQLLIATKSAQSSSWTVLCHPQHI